MTEDDYKMEFPDDIDEEKVRALKGWEAFQLNPVGMELTRKQRRRLDFYDKIIERTYGSNANTY